MVQSKMLRTVLFLIAASLLEPSYAFVLHPTTTNLIQTTTLKAVNLEHSIFVYQQDSCLQSSSLQLSVGTLDPTAFLSGIFSGVVGTPLILAIPIVAALAVASLIAFFIVSYASPAEPDEE